ncbi:MAG: hypothetical protein AAFX53_16765 [Bacteroidota bacterium]
MKRFLIFISAILALACTDRDDDLKAVNLRIKNVSTTTFDEVQVGEAEEVHENVAPGEYSEYLEYETAFRYAFIEIRSGEETFVFQPIDFEAETPLPIGFYTYELNVDEGGDVDLTFVLD